MKYFKVRHGQASLIVAQGLRFVAAGILNSGVTYIIYLLALQVVSYTVAYTISFTSGVVIALVLNGKWVFRTKLSARSAVQFPVVYGIQYVLGLALLMFFVRKLQVPAPVAPFAVLAFTTPITFIAMRYIFRPA
jgi:putative flippase GtrA